MDPYLTIDELSSRIKYSKQTLYNLISSKTFILGKHYFKPTPRKVLFKWSAIQEWIGDTSTGNSLTKIADDAGECAVKNTKSEPANVTIGNFNI